MKAITTTFIILFVLGLNSCYDDNEAELYGGNGNGNYANCTDTVSSYTGRLKGIIDAHCTDCHSPAGGYVDFTNYSGVTSKRNEIICRVVDPPVCGGNPMPPSGGLDPCDKQAFELWQQNGFRE